FDVIGNGSFSDSLNVTNTFRVAGNFLVDNAGNVGIGTTSPDWHLVVSGSGDQVLNVNTTSGTGSSASLWLEGGATNAAWQMFTNRADLAGSADNLAFYKQLGTAGVKMVISDSGNVGIGTTAPASLLNIHGGEINVSASARAKWINVST
ncbi:hypothetical protein HYV89_02340, partial [Candidatus Woesearchaeota archaeon]|nr:hypothetical protein [Candidatus Woesearchaeota archaeon]